MLSLLWTALRDVSKTQDDYAKLIKKNSESSLYCVDVNKADLTGLTFNKFSGNLEETCKRFLHIFESRHKAGLQRVCNPHLTSL